MALMLIVGSGCIAIFIGSVWAQTLPAPFLINAVLLAVQVLLVAYLFPRKSEKIFSEKRR